MTEAKQDPPRNHGPTVQRIQSPVATGLVAVFLLITFALIATVNATDPRALAGLDDQGDPIRAWAARTGWLHEPLEWVELIFGTAGMTVASAAFAAILWLRRCRRQALIVVVVMAATAAATSILKAVIGRARPEWQSPENLLESLSFPSGHASAVAAFATLIAVFVVDRISTVGHRTGARLLLAAVVALVCLDRVLLGRHYPSDVIAGSCLGAGLCLLGFAASIRWIDRSDESP